MRNALILLAVLLLASPTPARAQSSGPEYVVQEGDSLYSIAARFGATVESLQAANGIADATTIYVGQVLLIPGLEGITGRLTTHTAEFGDTLASLGLRHGVNPATLMRLNHLVNPAALYVGEAVIYPEGSREALQLDAARTHIVAPGETLLAIAARYRVSPQAIAAANGMAGAWAILPGDSLIIPGIGSAPTGLPAPVASVSLRPPAGEQGRTVAVQAKLDGEAALAGAFDLHPLRFAEAGGVWYALQGVETGAEPGMHTLAITVTLPAGVASTFAQLVPVRGVDYGSQILPPVDPATLDPAITGLELAHVESIAAGYTPVRRWQGLFILPSSGPTRSPFGVLRSYNEGQLISIHTGTDFAGAPGTPVYAAADGVVVMAETLTVRGNATLVDHGWGVYTGYWHQSQIEVKIGDVVTAGQEIGLVGSTGRVTGPHLHWEVWVGGVPVDPLEWTQATFP